MKGPPKKYQITPIFILIMSVRFQHTGQPDWFLTFTCHNWLHLFEITQSYDIVYKWFNYLKEPQQAGIMAYVIMPNHVHAIIHLHNIETDLNKLIGNGKRFMAYELIKRLKMQGCESILQQLKDALTPAEKSKGQKHKAFEPSFDAKHLNTLDFFYQKLNYIHYNQMRGR
jgi:REP element-mobilizing transposase RayT